jgi:Transglycosylase SLT domain
MSRRPSAVVVSSTLAAIAAIALGATVGYAPAASAVTIPVGIAGRAAYAGREPASYVAGTVGNQSAQAPAVATTSHQGAMHQVVLPDAFAVARSEITAAQLAKLGKLRYVRSLITVAGGAVGINGHPVQIAGVDTARFQSWTPLQTAARQNIWAALARGGFVTTATVAKRLRLHRGTSYQVTGARQPRISFGGSASLGIPGVDAIVGSATSKQLGLLPRIGVLISAPGASLAALGAQVSRILGRHTKFVSLRQQKVGTVHLPVDGKGSSGRPDNFLALFQDSAAMYCHGLSWTVLAAIGQIESADGQNEGPSSAGALGPMQFLPSTWARWGIDAFGETGPPNVMDPYDAVPSAAEYLCASGATSGPAGLSAAIFAYNHAQWYVSEVLALAQEYAREYG